MQLTKVSAHPYFPEHNDIPESLPRPRAGVPSMIMLLNVSLPAYRATLKSNKGSITYLCVRRGTIHEGAAILAESLFLPFFFGNTKNEEGWLEE